MEAHKGANSSSPVLHVINHFHSIQGGEPVEKRISFLTSLTDDKTGTNRLLNAPTL